MMKRSVYGVVALVVLGTLTGCGTPPAPPQPTVHSVEVSPQPAHPGDTVTVRIEASHSSMVFNGRAVTLVNPNGSGVGVDSCSTSLERPDEDDLTRATITFACELPELVSNGTWTLSYLLNYVAPTDNPFGPAPPRPSTVTFDVVGGSDDVSPPTLVSYEISPEVISRTAPFTVTALVSDDTPPIFLGWWNSPNSTSITFSGSGFSRTCRDVTLTPVSPTEAEVVVNCDAGWIGPVGPLTGQVTGNLAVRDALHNNARIPLTIDFEPGA